MSPKPAVNSTSSTPEAKETGTALTFKIPARSNVERCIVALKSLDADALAHLEREQLAQARATLVFAYWGKIMHKVRALLDAKREKRLLARLRENDGDVSELLYAVDGAKADDFLMGRDVRANRVYDGIETLFRDREQVERLAEAQPGYRRGDRHPLAVKFGL